MGDFSGVPSDTGSSPVLGLGNYELGLIIYNRDLAMP